LIMSVNISARQLQCPDLARTVEGVLRETGLEAGFLSLDITETAYVKASEVSIATLRSLTSSGYRRTTSSLTSHSLRGSEKTAGTRR
jgi:EAL domain-containing protein (putative c-di-GMP-specific phosphodiesterase class I)